MSPRRPAFWDHPTSLARKPDPPERRLDIATMRNARQSHDAIVAPCHADKRIVSAVGKSLETGTTIPPSKPRGRPSVTSREVVSQICNMTPDDRPLGSAKLVRIPEDDLDFDIMPNSFRVSGTTALPLEQSSKLPAEHRGTGRERDWFLPPCSRAS
jgi:hypothetical protein